MKKMMSQLSTARHGIDKELEGYGLNAPSDITPRQEVNTVGDDPLVGQGPDELYPVRNPLA